MRGRFLPRRQGGYRRRSRDRSRAADQGDGRLPALLRRGPRRPRRAGPPAAVTLAGHRGVRGYLIFWVILDDVSDIFFRRLDSVAIILLLRSIAICRRSDSISPISLSESSLSRVFGDYECRHFGKLVVCHIWKYQR